MALVKSVIGQSGPRNPYARKPSIRGTLDPSREITGAFLRDSLENPSLTAWPVLLAFSHFAVEISSSR